MYNVWYIAIQFKLGLKLEFIMFIFLLLLSSFKRTHAVYRGMSVVHISSVSCFLRIFSLACALARSPIQSNNNNNTTSFSSVKYSCNLPGQFPQLFYSFILRICAILRVYGTNAMETHRHIGYANSIEMPRDTHSMSMEALEPQAPPSFTEKWDVSYIRRIDAV